MAKDYYSPSQIKSANSCLRKWSGEAVYGWRQPDTPSTSLGKEVHAVMEAYLTQEKIPNPADKAGAIFLPGIKFLPEPGTPHLLCEQEVFIPEGDFNSGKDLRGFLDITILHHVDEDGTLWLVVKDGKTTSNLKYVKSEDELRRDPQCLVYCWAARQLSIGVTGYAHKNIRFSNVYFRTRGSPWSMESTVDMTDEELRQGMQQLADYTREKMLPWEGVPFADVPPNLDACGDYGGCHLRPECAQTGLPVYGTSPEATVAAQLMITRLTKVQGKPTMGLLDKKSSAAKAFALLLPPTAVSSAGSGINPPDGDVEGVSGIKVDPAAAPESDEEAATALGVDAPVEEMEVQEETKEAPAPDLLALVAAAPEQEEAKNPDTGYVPADKPLVAGLVGVTKGRPSEKPELWDKVEKLIQTLQADPDAWLRAKQINHPIVAKLVGGSLKLRNNVTKLDEIKEIIGILDACVGNNMAAVKPAPATSKAPPKNAVEAAADALEDAKVALVTAKASLADNLKQLKELNQKQEETSSDADVDAYTAYNTEVYLPSRKRVQSGEAKVAELTTALEAAVAAKAVKDEEERQAKEKAAAEQATQTQATKEVEQVSDKAQMSALGKVAFQQQPIGGGKSSCWLIRGSVFTRVNKGNYTFIDELILPYRRAAETAAVTAFYGAIKEDGAGRICQELIKALTNGTLILPRFLVAPARTNYLQDRVIDALSPYFEDVLLPIS